MAQTLPLAPSSLLFDSENPRLNEPSLGQREAQRAMATNQQRKLVALARDIVQNRLDPSNLPIVMPLNDDLKRYVVLEGNRRIVALKALENPDSLVGALEPGLLKDLRELSHTYQAAPIDSVECVVVNNREEARHWIELRHTGENQGAGLVSWGADESARFRARSGQKEIHSQALDLLEHSGHLTPDRRSKVPSSSFRRLLNTPEVREKCGLELKHGELLFLADKKQVAKALMYIVNDLTTGRAKTSHIYTRENRIKYANSIPEDVVVKPTSKEGKRAAARRKGKSSRPKSTRVRDNLIPYDCALGITDQRVSEIERELRTLSLENYPNAISVLFRVFIELSVDVYVESKKITLPNEDATLGCKMRLTLEDLLAKQKLNAKQAQPVHRAMHKNSFLAPSITLLHSYVHNQYVFPTPSDLRANWNNLQPFFIAVWSP
jgi:hypothetical protein